MNLADFSIKRPVTTLMIVFIILVLGFVSFTRLGIDLFPDMTLPVAAVITQYQGVAPEEMENLITKPIEQAISTIGNVKSIQSVTNQGLSIVIIEFNWGTNMDFAMLDVREKVDMIKAYLPDDSSAPMIVKYDPSMMPVMQIALYGGSDIVQLKKLADDVITDRLLRVEGVASVDTIGGREREIAIHVDPDKLAFYGISMTQISNVLKAENLNLPGGSIDQGKKEYLIRTTAEFEDISEIENLPITLPQGGIVHLKDISRVEDTYKDVSTISRYNGKPSITLSIMKQSGSNTVQVSNLIKAEMEKLERELPANVNLKPIFDQSEFIEMSIKNVSDNAVNGSILAVLVLYLFLRNVRSTLVIGISIPISIIATFVLIYFGKLTLNIMSLGGLALGVGMLVDNSIVVLENIFSHRQSGEDPIKAALSGTSEVGMAVTASTLTTVAVFLPMVFVQGLTAQIFKELALTVTFSLMASLAVALTLTPLLSSRLLTDMGITGETADSSNNPRIFKWLLKPLNIFSTFYDKLEMRYGGLLRWALGHRKQVVIISVVAFVASLAMIPLIGTEFLPKTDSGTININFELADGTKLDETNRIISDFYDKIANIPEIQDALISIGSGSSMESSLGGSSANIGSIMLQLVPLNEREASSEQVAEEIRKIAEKTPGAKISVSVASTMDFAAGGLNPVSISIEGDNLDRLKQISDEVMDIVKSIPNTREVTCSLEEGRPELRIKVDRDKAALYGVSSGQIAQMVNSAVSGMTATTYKVNGEEIDVVIRAEKDLVNNTSKLRSLLIPSPTGAFITLGDVAEIINEVGPVSISRQDQARVVTVTAQILGRDMGSVNQEIQQKLDQMNLPDGYSITMGGEQQEMMQSFQDLSLAFVLAVLLVYMVMAAQFESLVQPFIILFTVPLAIIGVVLSLLVTGRNISIVSFMGVIMLAGIVVNNAIVLVDFINQLRQRGMSRYDAIVKAGPDRLRPILMTTLTTVLGLIPMALGLGEGGELGAPLATVVIGGLTFSTLLTLVVIPVLYTIFEDFGDIWGRMRVRFIRKIKVAKDNV